MRYYDKKNHRLVYLGSQASSLYWDKLWQEKNIRSEIKNLKFDLLVLPNTQKYLPRGARILEGGCGIGLYVFHLSKHGYNVIGVDFAKDTVKRINDAIPELKVYYADVRRLNFPDNYFDGYWSIGVIEHFYNGYEQIIREARRVLRPKGFFFLTFPYMSYVREIKAKLNMYSEINLKLLPPLFYQFALNHHFVIETVLKHKFTLIKQQPFDGFRGFKDEMTFLNFILNPIAYYSNKSILIGGLRFIISKIVEPFASHCILLVFQKL